MSITWIIIIAIHIVSLLFLVASLYRILKFLRRYRLKESKYTMLFGFMEMPQVIFLYIATIAFIIVGSIFLTNAVT